MIVFMSFAIPSLALGALTGKEIALLNYSPHKRETRLGEILNDIIKKELTNCPLSFIIDPNFGYKETINHLFSLPNSKQVNEF